MNSSKLKINGMGQQRGAVSAIAVLFLATIVVSVLTYALKQAAVSSSNALVHEQSEQALFIAESAAERSAWRLKNGSVCDATFLETGISFANGSFDIQSAVLNASVCELQIKAIRGDTTRIIDVGLSVAASGIGAWVGGKNGLFLQRIAGVWSTVVVTGFSTDVNGLYCVDDNCLAVGKDGRTAVWDGTAWTLIMTSATEDFEDVACNPSDFTQCIAVGKEQSSGGDGMIRTWNGTVWAAQQIFDAGAKEDFDGVSCFSSICYIVGKDGAIFKYDLSSGIFSSEVVDNNATTDLKGVDCVSASECWAVSKRQGNQFRLAHRNASATWTEVLITSGAKEDLEAVSCSDASNCWAVGKLGKALRYNGSWTYTTSLRAITTRDAKDVHCRSDGQCLVTAKNGDMALWNSAWFTEVSGVASNLESVYFMDDSASTSVALVSWREIFN